MRYSVRCSMPVGLVLSLVVGCSSSPPSPTPGANTGATPEPQRPDEFEIPKDGLYRSAAALFVDLPREAYPKSGEEEGLSRAAARKWMKANLTQRKLEWTATVTGVTIQQDGPFSVTYETDVPKVSMRRDGMGSYYPYSSFGPEVNLGGEICQAIVYRPDPTVRPFLCTAEEAQAIRDMKGKKVTFQAKIMSATISDVPCVTKLIKDFKKTEPDRLCIELEITHPSLNGMLPKYNADHE